MKPVMAYLKMLHQEYCYDLNIKVLICLKPFLLTAQFQVLMYNNPVPRSREASVLPTTF